MEQQEDTLWTVARIAEHWHAARHRVEYIIDTRGITPLGRAGIARVFRWADVQFIGEELSAIEAAREEVSRGN